MSFSKSVVALLLFWTAAAVLASSLHAQGTGNSSSIQGTVTDPSGAVVTGATVEIQNPVSGYNRTTVTDGSGDFSFSNVPYNPYHMTVTSTNFASYVQDVDVRSSVPVTLKVALTIGRSLRHGHRHRRRRPDRNRPYGAHRHRPPAFQ